MRDREWKRYLQTSFRQEIQPGRQEETLARCIGIMRENRCRKEARTGFWQFLSDVLRFEGMSVCGLQAGVLLLVCMGIGAASDILRAVPTFTPLFALSVMPVLFRSRFYKMDELEAVTRASGAEIILAQLILSGAANLICVTVLLALGIHLENVGTDKGRIILYGLVPYLFCMTVILRLVRGQRGENIPFCVAAAVSAGSLWGISARLLPGLYETSATGLWILLFFVFAVFFGKEIYFLLAMRKEGKIYGIMH